MISGPWNHKEGARNRKNVKLYYLLRRIKNFKVWLFDSFAGKYPDMNYQVDVVCVCAQCI